MPLSDNWNIVTITPDCNCSVAAARGVSPAANGLSCPHPKPWPVYQWLWFLPPITPHQNHIKAIYLDQYAGFYAWRGKATSSSCSALYNACE